MSTLKAVIFDLGGTLMGFGEPQITFRQLNRIGLQGLYEHLGERGDFSLPEWKEFSADLDTRFEQAWQDSRVTLRSVCIDTILPGALSRWQLSSSPIDIEEMLAVFHRAMRPYITLYEDTVATLEQLRGRRLKIGLISNTIWTAQMHDADLKRTGILPYFDDRVYSSAIGYRKPHPAIFGLSLQACRVAADEAVYVGDRLWDDISGAQAAGIKAVLKETPWREESDQAIVPDARIKSLHELWDILSRSQKSR